MTFGPPMQISPRSPSATYFVGSVTSANLMTMPGMGIPQDPVLGFPVTGEKVPVGDVSVMPHPSAKRHPVNSSKRCCTSSGSGAPPEAHHLTDDRSIFSIFG